jgi:excisionase family DNA binding protein
MKHICIDEEIIGLPVLAPSVAAFLDRMHAAVDNPKITKNDLVALVYGRENPLLDHAMVPGHSMVTAETLKHPVYLALMDLLDRKRIVLGTLDVAKVRACYTIPVNEAAERLGVHPGAVRQAIKAKRLSAWKIDGQWLLRSESIESFRMAMGGERRGPPPQLRLRWGTENHHMLKVKHLAELERENRTGPKINEGTLTSWERVGVFYGANGAVIFEELEPGD